MKNAVKTLFRLEFKSAFRQIYGIAFLVAYWGMLAYLVISYNLSYTNVDISAVLSSMSIASAAMIPILSHFNKICRFGATRSINLSVMDCTPFSAREKIIGKFLANLTFIGMAVAPMLLLPIINAYLGVTDYLSCYSMILTFLVFEIMLLAISQYIALRVKNTVLSLGISVLVFIIIFFIGPARILIPRDAIVSFIGIMILSAIGALAIIFKFRKKVLSFISAAFVLILPIPFFVLFPERYEGLMERIIESASLFLRFDRFALGIFDIAAFVLFGAIAALFISLSLILAYPSTKNKGFSGLKVTSTVLSCAIVVSLCASFVSFKHPVMDATLNHKYSISDTTRDFLESLEDEVSLYYISPLTGEESLTVFLERYASVSNKITLKEIYPSTDADIFEKYGLDPSKAEAGSIIVASDKRNIVAYPSDMFIYSNENLGFADLEYSYYMQYLYYYYAYDNTSEIYESLLYDTVTCFRGDYIITSYIEYVSKENLPTVFILEGHGEAALSGLTLSYLEACGFTLGTLDIEEENKVPEYAQGILINAPTEDISEAEYEILSAYLLGGGQITLLSDDNVVEQERLKLLMSDYGLSLSEEPFDIQEEVKLSVNANHDVTAMLSEITEKPVSLKNPIPFNMDRDAKDSLLLTSLLTYSNTETESEESSDVYTFGAAAETADGAKLVWISGASDFDLNHSDTANIELLICTSNWTSVRYTSKLEKINPVVYAYPAVTIDSAVASVAKMFFVILPIAVVGFGAFDLIRRKRIDNKNI